MKKATREQLENEEISDVYETEEDLKEDWIEEDLVDDAEEEDLVDTEETLMTEMETAMGSKDWAVVSKVSKKIDTLVKAKEKALEDDRANALDMVSSMVKDEMLKVLNPIVAAGDLDLYDGVWLAYDFGDKEGATLRLTKTAPRVKSVGRSGGGGGKKFAIGHEELMAKHGNKVYPKTGLTFVASRDATTDRNERQAIRIAMLKLEGLI